MYFDYGRIMWSFVLGRFQWAIGWIVTGFVRLLSAFHRTHKHEKEGKTKDDFPLGLFWGFRVSLLCMYMVSWFVPFGTNAHAHSPFTIHNMMPKRAFTRKKFSLPNSNRYLSIERRDILWGSRFLCVHTNLHTRLLLFSIDIYNSVVCFFSACVCVCLRLGVSADINDLNAIEHCKHT